ncbi:uncharacterized protein AB675_7357 [Cyphellophora attinorum]|uniref:NTF2-like domain-containing protein n=1 Tax=Cyphellophora attinorum TaxID=1664694 RepID=A0A0N1GZ22_9EURO|nr:uncharacterized protein AB675_7357 [Phialophora attinorum]KPI36250.1 hypothetical protein AB675_7357 [Phialophora attinorum]
MLRSFQPMLLWWYIFLTGTAAQVRASSSTPCLSPGESYNIALRWLQIFQTNENGTGTGSAIVASTLTSNFTYYDEGASFGNATAVYDSAGAVYNSVSGSGYSGSLVTNVTYSIIESFASCDTSVNSNVTVGTPISYRGTDYLKVDLESRLIYNVTSSSDLLNYYIQLGAVKQPS